MNGGMPVRAELLPYGRQAIEPEDIATVVEVLNSAWITTGPKVQEFEQSFAARVGAGHAVCFSSGTAALHGAVFAAGLDQGDEAITTPLTFCASANCIVYQGGRPVFADVQQGTLLIDPEQVAARVTSRTKAVVAVDYAGHPAALDELLALAELHGLVVIEDACHALGAEYRGRRVGSISHLTVFSFHPVKHITTGEGGMVTTDDANLAWRLRTFRNHGIDSDARERQAAGRWAYDMSALGFNYRLSDIGCALGLAQLQRLDANLCRRRQIVAQYEQGFRDLPLILSTVNNDAVSAWHLYPIRLQLERLSAGRGQIYAALRAENIGVNVHYVPVHYHSFYRKRFGYKGGEFPVSEDAYERLISLPMFHAMTSQDVEDVIRAVRKVVGFYVR